MPQPNFKLVTISAVDVSTNEQNYNSYFHTAVEAPHLSPPDERPYAYSTWLPLVASTQHIPLSSIQIITLSASQTRLLLSAQKSSLLTGVMNRMYEEDLVDEIINPKLSTLTFPSSGLFLRLDMCSAKDGVGGSRPLKSMNEIVLKLLTSVQWRGRKRWYGCFSCRMMRR